MRPIAFVFTLFLLIGCGAQPQIEQQKVPVARKVKVVTGKEIVVEWEGGGSSTYVWQGGLVVR